MILTDEEEKKFKSKVELERILKEVDHTLGMFGSRTDEPKGSSAKEVDKK